MNLSKKLDKQIDNKSQNYYSDFDLIMHSYMLQKFSSDFSGNDALELGAGNGNFTIKLSKIFKNLTVVEGSSKSINKLKKIKFVNINLIQGDLENLQKLPIKQKFDNIFLIHTFEHINERKKLLKNIYKILKKNGKFFIVTPNANAGSRRLAVKMGIIKKTTSVTWQEKKHGHFITFNARMLAQEVKQSSFKIYKSGGIFFKALANYQIDLNLKNKIINKKYLNACYELGDEFPELCSSIYIIAKK